MNKWQKEQISALISYLKNQVGVNACEVKNNITNYTYDIQIYIRSK